MAITTVNDLVNGLANTNQRRRILKNITVPKAIGSFQSSWLGVGFPGAGATPPLYTAGSGYTCDKSTIGAIPYTNAAVKNWLARFFAESTIAGTLFIYDRLWSCSGMGYANQTWTVTTPGSLPARITDNGLGCELWVEQFVAAGAASGTLTCNYVAPGGGNEVGVIPAVVSAPVIGQMQPVPMATGATGIKQLTSVVNSATWTSGTWGMTICKPVAEIELPLAGIGKTLDWAALGLPDLVNDMCLFFIWQGGAATANQIIARLNIIDK
jgi:hypothetical protein